MPNITTIPAPRVSIIDDRTGLMSREWYMFFLNLFTLTGSGSNDISLQDVQIGPPQQDVSILLAQPESVSPTVEDTGDIRALAQNAQISQITDRYDQLITSLSDQLNTLPPSVGGSVTSVDVSGGSTGLTTSGGPVTSAGTITLAGTLSPVNGGTGVPNNAASTLTLSGAFASTFTITGVTSVTFPTSGTLATTSQLPVGANPTASVGLSAVNGVATTFMRSDGAPALSQSISPTWTGNHTFAPSSGNTLFSAGSVGIGVSPSETLHVVNESDTQIRVGTPFSSTVFWEFGRDNLSTGDLIFSDGTDRLHITTGGNLALQTTGAGLHVKEGTNCKQGVATMVGGTVTVSNTSVTANSRIFLTPQNTSGGAGSVSVTGRTAGTSFTIGSTNVSDTRDVAYFITEPS